MNGDLVSTPTAHDETAAEALIGCLLVDPVYFDDVAGIVEAADFYSRSLATIFKAVADLHSAGEPIDTVILARRLDETGHLSEIGGTARIVRLMQAMPNGAHAEHYARIVREDADRRRSMDSAREYFNALQDRSVDVSESTGRHRQQLDAVDDRALADAPVAVGLALVEMFDALDADDEPAMATGWPDLDSMLSGGIRPGQLVILAARPSVGKTALAANLALNLTRQGKPALFVSLEQPRVELVERMASSESGIPHAKIRERRLDQTDFSALTDAGNKIASWPLQVDDSPRRTVTRIAAIARRLRRRDGLRLLILDYLQLISPEDSKAPREQQVASMSRQLKLLAKELSIPVVALAQLNRSIENRESKEPRLSDLRESGAIEQDADIVLFLDRPADYRRDADPTDATLAVAKNRSGKRGKVRLHWHGETMTFRSAAIHF